MTHARRLALTLYLTLIAGCGSGPASVATSTARLPIESSESSRPAGLLGSPNGPQIVSLQGRPVSTNVTELQAQAQDLQPGMLSFLWTLPQSSFFLSGNPVQLSSSGVGGTIEVNLRVTNQQTSLSNQASLTFETQGPNAWAAFHNDIQHSGRSPHLVSSEAAQVRWSFLTQRAILSSACIDSAGDIYFGSNDGNFYALHSDGQLKWVFPSGGEVISSAALMSDGSLCFGSSNGFLWGRQADGGFRFTLNLGRPVVESPAVAPDGTIYIASGNTLFSFDSDGRDQGKSTFGPPICGSPAFAPDGTLYFAIEDGTLWALRRQRPHWRLPLPAARYTSPAVGPEGHIYVGADDGRFYAISPEGKLLWSFRAGSRIQSSPAVARDGTIYFGCNDSKLYALNPQGQVLWTHTTTGAFFTCSPAIDREGKIICGSAEKKVFALYPNGKLAWEVPIRGILRASPAIAKDGSVAVGSDDFRFYLIR